MDRIEEDPPPLNSRLFRTNKLNVIRGSREKEESRLIAPTCPMGETLNLRK